MLHLPPLKDFFNFAILNPAGPIGADEKWLLEFATGLMLVVVIPVIVLTLIFAWRYRASRRGSFAAAYMPNWSHSRRIEVFVWGIPCVIVAILTVINWRSTHRLDPYRPVHVGDTPALKVDVVSLDWKWLFIYPDLKVASVNQLVMPTNTPVEFRLTSSDVMNSFFIPRLGSQIYTMTGMITHLGLIASETGTFPGISANFSGDGFAKMHFDAHAVTPAAFKAWVAKVRAGGGNLDGAAYYQLTRPSENVPVSTYATVSPHVFDAAVALCDSAKACQQQAEHGAADMMHMAMAGSPSAMATSTKQEH